MHHLPMHGLSACRSTSILIGPLAETRIAKPSVDHHGLFYTLKGIPQRMALKVFFNTFCVILKKICAQT